MGERREILTRTAMQFFDDRHGCRHMNRKPWSPGSIGLGITTDTSDRCFQGRVPVSPNAQDKSPRIEADG